MTHPTTLAGNNRRRKKRNSLNLCPDCADPVPLVGQPLCGTCWFKKAATKIFKNRSIWQKLAWLYVWQGGKCTYSGKDLIPGVNTSLDHRISQKNGGKTVFENLHFVDRSVNLTKNKMNHEEFIVFCRGVALAYPKEHN